MDLIELLFLVGICYLIYIIYINPQTNDNNQPANANNLPVNTNNPQVNTNNPPVNANNPPANTDTSPPSIITYTPPPPPVVIDYAPPVYNPPSSPSIVIDYAPPVITYTPSPPPVVIDYAPPVITYTPPPPPVYNPPSSPPVVIDYNSLASQLTKGNNDFLNNILGKKNNSCSNLLITGNIFTYPDNSKLYKNILFKTKEFKNGNISLTIQDDGNLCCRDNGNVLWCSNTTSNPNGYLAMQVDSNLVIYDQNNNPIWHTDTWTSDADYVQLSSTGYLLFMNSNDKIIDIYPKDDGSDFGFGYKQSLKKYLSTFHYDITVDNDAVWVMSDKRGYFWPCKWSELKDINRGLTEVSSQDCDKCRFRGWFRSQNDSQWDVEEIKVDSGVGYISIRQGIGYPDRKNDNNINNYNSESDRNNFIGDSNYKRYPRRLNGGSEKSNYIPGYDRSSYVDGNSSGNTYRFLISDRGSGNWNQAFILYKIKNREDYAKDIFNNNKQIVYDITRNDTALHMWMFTVIGAANQYAYTDTFLNRIRQWDNFTNKTINTFANKLNNIIKENFENNLSNINYGSNYNHI